MTNVQALEIAIEHLEHERNRCWDDKIEEARKVLQDILRDATECKLNRGSNWYTDTLQVCTCGTTQVCPLHQNALTPPY